MLVAHLYSAGEFVVPCPGASGCSPRVGFVVSRAVGGAVVRTAVKRRLRHLVMQRLDALPAGSCLVVRALPPAATADSAELAADLDGALRRLLGQERP
jgi:ribonuclease P protein component